MYAPLLKWPALPEPKMGSFCDFDPDSVSRSRLIPFLLPLSQPHPGAPAVFLDELDSGRFQGVLQPLSRRVHLLG